MDHENPPPPDEKPASGIAEPPGPDPGDRSQDAEPHHALNAPASGPPDPTEWPDPYDDRPDPLAPAENTLDEVSTPTGATSTSQPHPHLDEEAIDAEPPRRDKLDD